ncbi:MAG: MgtC/SapB family protein, partial [Bacilli bacterium]|nr:MgtC/SapB family protein [Bacilli bacterium]
MDPIVTIDQFIAKWFNNLKFSNGVSWGNLILCSIAIIICVVLCGLVGLEREKRGRSAGLRTHLLVGVGSCIIMIISIYGFPDIKDSTRDVARLAAQVVAGVGFLGAGAIIHNNGGIKGLTTASTIWLVMAIGLSCGSMNFILAILGTVVVMIVLVTFRRI